MARSDQYSVFWQTLLWWGSWVLVSAILTNWQYEVDRFVFRGLALLICILIVVTVNIKLLLPQLYFRKRAGAFVVAGILLVVLSSVLVFGEVFPWARWLNPRPEHLPPLPPEIPAAFKGGPGVGLRWIGRMTPSLIAFLGSTLIAIARFANEKEKEAIRSDKEKLETELKFLKSQVNPHFLFNALNNIYSLSVVQAPQTPETVMQLSEILRYMVYDSNEEAVPLSSEISYIENYVNLMSLKDSRGMNIQCDLDSPESDPKVAPLLFIPFVENAFKHSMIEDLSNGFIRMSLKVNAGQVEFVVVNSLPESGFTKDKIGGVGLENIKKRLELLYPGAQHELTIHQTDSQFEIQLKLSVQC